MSYEHDKQGELDRLNLVNDTYAILCKYLPQHECRGYNFHTRAQTIAETVAKEFDLWVEQNNRLGKSEP